MSDIEWPKEVKSDTHPGDRHPDHDDWGEEEDYDEYVGQSDRHPDYDDWGEEEDYEDEYDGQPDELTEWMDFDPDC